MNKEVIVESSGGIGFMGSLTLVFIVLKLCNVITWSWWWILCPIWIPILVVLVLLLILGILYLFVTK